MRPDAEYVDDALAVLARLRNDGLPAYEDEFFRLLSDQSHRNIGELTRAIQKAAGEIRSRIEPVNESLRRSPFDTDRTLRIDVKDRRSPAASEFLTELVGIVSGSWKEEDRTAAERRFDRMAAVLERLDSGEPADLRWRNLVLDTRLHVGSSVSRLILKATTPTITIRVRGCPAGRRRNWCSSALRPRCGINWPLPARSCRGTER